MNKLMFYSRYTVHKNTVCYIETQKLNIHKGKIVIERKVIYIIIVPCNRLNLIVWILRDLGALCVN